MSKDIALARKEFYADLIIILETSKAVMSRKDALQLLVDNPYFDDLDASLKTRLNALVNSKTNWGKNLLLSCIQVEMLEYLLGL